MIGKLPKDDHRELFRTRLVDLINPQHELAPLAHAMDWKYFDEAFEKYYTVNSGRPSMLIRLMVGVLALKRLYNLGDEKIRLHKPHTQRIAKGEPHRQYEFGSKVGLIASGKKW